MLRLENISKNYGNVQALKNVSLCFRKNEFVCILGPSGCGKTTTLNIIGGLDHYSSGDLYINGVSTKNYKDHDWDVYRNHRIGFIFQSYNLIPHQTILENVELALTIAGVSKEERVKKSKEALDKVGLKDLYNKKPNQLSGGQCQRVAIARALVNEPDILLADEPTGALDSVTSIQIMDLVKEISKEKLVVMVTHNPDLAKEYSTRIIELLDGEVTSDSNPYSVEEEMNENNNKKIDKEKAKMSWWTSFKLSSKNLWSKKKRTFLTILASSIGIVGISAVLAISSGVKGYISDLQDDMLSGNPVEISESSLSLTSLVSNMSTSSKASAISSSYKDGKLDVEYLTETLISMSNSMSSSLISNELTEEYEKFIDELPTSYYSAISKEWGINIKNNLYTSSDVHLVNENGEELNNARYSISAITSFAETIMENARDGEWKSYSSMVDSYTDAINQSLDKEYDDYVLSQYDLVYGSMPSNENDLLLVLNHNNKESDFVLTLLGFYGQDEFLNDLYHFSDDDNEDEELWEKQQQIDFEEIVNKEFYYYSNDKIFKYNEDYGKYSLTSDPINFISKKSSQPFEYDFDDNNDIEGGEVLKISGIIIPKEDVSYGCYDAGLYYTPQFSKKFLNDNNVSKDELGDEYTKTLTGFIKNYLENNEDSTSYTSSIMSLESNGITTDIIYGIGYNYNLNFTENGETSILNGNVLVGSQGEMSSLMNMLSSTTGSSTTSSGISINKTASLSLRDVGGSTLPDTIKIYPLSFNSKYLVTDYLDKWNSEDDITFENGETITSDQRSDVTYTDDLEVIISLINGMIDIVTIALICFTALSLVVSTVMIGIITYISVIERVKEIGVIRSLGGRKKDVSFLFNAETFIIGLLSGVFGIGVTYLIELIINLTIGNIVNIGMIANLPIYTAIIVILCSILLTVVAGFIPSRSAAKQDPVVALRTE